VEAAFYRELAPRLLSAGVCAVAEPLAVRCDGDSDVRLTLTDLRERFPASADDLSLEQVSVSGMWPPSSADHDDSMRCKQAKTGTPPYRGRL
jgi:hypothetical protein